MFGPRMMMCGSKGITLALAQQSSTVSLAAYIAANDPTGAENVTVTNDLTQPKITTGDLTGLNVTFINNGELQGETAGDNGFEASTDIELINNGWIRGAGGNGGQGGTGGSGYYCIPTGTTYQSTNFCLADSWYDTGTNAHSIDLAGFIVTGTGATNQKDITCCAPSYPCASVETPTSMIFTEIGASGISCSAAGGTPKEGVTYKSRTDNSSANSSGGSGGSGGLGATYNNPTENTGVAGALGGTGAGQGGTGGTGGAWSLTGATGATGFDGNSGSGQSGSAGSVGGNSITGTTFLIGDSVQGNLSGSTTV